MAKKHSEGTRSLPEFAERTPAVSRTKALKPFQATPHPDYRYTSPSYMGKRAIGARRKRGCIEEPRDRWCFKKKDKKGDKCFHSEAEAVEAADGSKVSYKPQQRFTGKRCTSKESPCAKKDQTYDSFCAGANSDPCGSPRATCPVQLVWVNGKPNLRFCKEQGEQGYMVPVNNVQEAMRISDDACRDWPYKLGIVERVDGSESEGGWDPEFFERNAPQIPAMAKQSYPEREGLGDVSWMAEAARESLQQRSDEVLSGWPKPPGRQRRGHQRSGRPGGGGNMALWLMGGTAVGLLAMKMMKGADNV